MMVTQPAAINSTPVHPRALKYTDSILSGMIPNESELTAGVIIEPGKRYGFFTDTSLCIGCKSCEVACKEWNFLPIDDFGLTGMSYDNTGSLGASTWRHVLFVEKISDREQGRAMLMQPYQSNWLMMSNVCKHCRRAGCLEACPTGALFRTEFDTVVVQQDICNGCGYCVPSCPFGVIELNLWDGKAHKCTLCYDRLKSGLEPACAKACPTNSIQFGEVDELVERAQRRVTELHSLGIKNARLYGAPGAPGATRGIEALHAFFLLLDKPEVYNLPPEPTLPSAKVLTGLLAGTLTMVSIGIAAAVALFLNDNR
jgi:formate dehydrogenase iron-sulfur subunit